MQVGFQPNQGLDCSSLIGLGMMRVLGLSGWPRSLRHTRQMVMAMEEAGVQPRPLQEVMSARRESDIGALIFSHRMWDIGNRAAWRIAHCSVLTGFGEAGADRPVSLQAQADFEHRVVERPSYGLAPGAPESQVFSSAALARVVLERSAEIVPLDDF